jgi:RNA polymerase sigma factor (sigma-70 family)
MIAEVVHLDTRSEELFEKYKRLVNFVAWKFVRNHGGDFEETQADSYMYYVEAVREYDGRVPLHSHISFWVWTRLLDKWRTEATRKNRVGPFFRSDLPQWLEETVIDRSWRQEWSLEEFLATLTEDAKTVVKLCLETPEELRQIAEDKGGSPRNYRSTVKQWLESVGWSYERIRESFEEIKTALK